MIRQPGLHRILRANQADTDTGPYTWKQDTCRAQETRGSHALACVESPDWEVIIVTEAELKHLRRSVELAAEALEAGDGPFGSVLVGEDGTVLAEDRNRDTSTGDPTSHPEFELARWAALNLTPGERAAATVYTSTEHCTMCAAATGWVGVGRVVYVSSSAQLTAWRAELGDDTPPPIRILPVQEVVPGMTVEGPVPELLDQLRDLHRHALGGT